MEKPLQVPFAYRHNTAALTLHQPDEKLAICYLQNNLVCVEQIRQNTIWLVEPKNFCFIPKIRRLCECPKEEECARDNLRDPAGTGSALSGTRMPSGRDIRTCRVGFQPAFTSRELGCFAGIFRKSR